MRDYDEIEVPRFSREITLNRSRVDEPSNETPNELAGLLQPFTGVLDLRPIVGEPGFLDLTFAVLQPLVIERFSERTRRITRTTPPDRRSNQVPRETRRDVRDGPRTVLHRIVYQNFESAPVPIGRSAPSSEVKRRLDRPTVIDRFAERTRRTSRTLTGGSEPARREIPRDVRDGSEILVHRASHENLEPTPIPTKSETVPSETQRRPDQALVVEQLSEPAYRTGQTTSPDSESESSLRKSRRGRRGRPGMLVHRVAPADFESTSVSTRSPSDIQGASVQIPAITRFSEQSNGKSGTDVHAEQGMLVHRVVHTDLDSTPVPTGPSASPMAAQRLLDRSLVEEGASKQIRRVTQTASRGDEPKQIEGPNPHRELTVAQALRSEHETERTRESQIDASSQSRDRSDPSKADSPSSQRQRTPRETAGLKTNTQRLFLQTDPEPNEASQQSTSPRSVTDVRVASSRSSLSVESQRANQGATSFRTVSDTTTGESSITPDINTPISENETMIGRTETETRDAIPTEMTNRWLRRRSQRAEHTDRNRSSDSEPRSSRRKRDAPNRERNVPFSPLLRDLIQRTDDNEVERPQSKETSPPASVMELSARPLRRSPIRPELDDPRLHRTEMTILDREKEVNGTDIDRANDSRDSRTTVETTSTTVQRDAITETHPTPTTSFSQNADDVSEMTVTRERPGSPSRKGATVGEVPSEDPSPVSDSRSGSSPELTLKRDRLQAPTEEEVSPDNLSRKIYKQHDNINPEEETTYPATASSKYPMNNHSDIDSLVDQLYAKFERKVRTERERQGL